MDNTSFDEDDLHVEIFVSEEPKNIDEHIALLANAPIRVTHLPTSISAVGEGQGSQVKNKEKAIELLKEQLARNNIQNE